MDQLSLALSIISLFVSAIALIIAIWHNMKTFTPIVTVLQDRSPLEGQISLVVQNKGIGPATITKIEYLLDKKSIGSDPEEIVKLVDSMGIQCKFYSQKRDVGSVLSANESFTPMKLIFPDSKIPQVVIDLFNRLHTRVWYKSLYGIEYRMRSGR